ncbi:protein phosphatase 1 regulatory subunit SDS22 [Cornus florida]|uniref:protein phosphatase 1 regulatory subunit SDS22 n=1 Tax=Cornus florida TaxID=4283 RepID=UPI00289DCCA4|nr:protein phosphatase 1 regulatory subunit SDS22 [Cornus florida]
MTVLSSKQILQDNKTTDPDAITALALNHKALSDVSCLSEFKNLERLDLRFNNLSSLEGLRSCVNLKWVSVVQNKLQSLKGVEGLTKLTVLNAGKNKLRSMEEVRSLVNLRALILNDNEIVSICRLDNMKELNTLVLSRNPIREIGESLAKMKSITKLSLSNCQLQSIDSSLKSCVELKELRLAHNDIKTLPAELARNTKVQNLDLGNNLITSWSDLKVISSLVNLKNLNLQGNPVAEKDKLAKKIKKMVPNLQIFNARPINQNMKNEKGDRVDDSSLNMDLDKKELKHKKQKRKELFEGKDPDHKGKSAITEKELKKKVKEVPQKEANDIDEEETPVTDSDMKELKRKKQKTNVLPKDKASDPKEVSVTNDNKIKRKSKKVQQYEANVIDDGETPFTDLFAADTTENVQRSGANKTDDKAIQDVNMVDGLVTFPVKRKKIKSRGKGHSALQLLSPAAEVGLGGPSTWDD